MFDTWVTREFGVKYPIIQGSMHWLARAELAAAVSNAGGMGVIGARGFSSSKELREEIRKTRSLTDKPFAVNFTVMPAKVPIVWEDYINASLEEGVKIIETSGRSPEPYMEWLRAAKVKVIHKVTRMRDALTAQKLGVDAVTVIGYESGGHPGIDDVTSLVRIPKAVDSLKIPVIAGGGFADGRGLIAALALGAQGVVMGTRFMASQECPLHPKIKELIRRNSETDTVIVERSIKNAARVIKTDFTQKLLDMEARGATLEEILSMVDGHRVLKGYNSGDISDSIIYCGQAAGLIKDVPTVKEIIDGIISQAREVMGKLKGMGIEG